MRNRVLKVLTIMIITLMMMASANKVFAANVTISTSGGSYGINKDGKVESTPLIVTVTFPSGVTAGQADISVTFKGKNTPETHTAMLLESEIANKKASAKFTPTSAGEATIVVNGIVIAKPENMSVDGASTKINIQDTSYVEPKPDPKPDPKPNNTATNNSTTNTTTNTAANNTVKPEVKNPEFKTVNEKVYAVSNCNVRSSCSTEVNDNKIGGLSKGQEVTRTGTSAKWSRIEYNGKTAYVYNTLLTTEKPEETEENEVENEVVEDGFKNELDLLKDDIGVLPEVGTNIATVSFVGIAIISLAVVLIVRFRITKNEIDD